MQLIGRKKELKTLNQAWKKEDAFILISGRHAVGKTAFIKTFADHKNHLYFAARSVSDQMNRLAFEQAFKQHLNGDIKSGDNKITWEELFRLYAEKTETGGKMLIVDNFEYLLEANGDFARTIRRAWQQFFKPNGVTLILVIGNASGQQNMMADKGFASEVTCQIALAPVTFVEMMREYPHHDFSQLMLMYAVTGGVPAYWYIFDHCINDKQVRDTIEANILNGKGIFFDEVSRLLEREVWEPSVYHSLLSALSADRSTQEELAAFTGFKIGKIRDALANLETLGYVAQTASIGKKKLFGKQRVEYHIADPMFDFWYTFVFPYYEDIKDNRSKGAKQALKKNFAQYIQKWFRQVAGEIFLVAAAQDSLPMRTDAVGEYFDDDDNKIPIVAVDEEQKKIFFGDCVFTSEAYTKKKFDYFVEKTQEIKRLKKTYKDYTWIFGVFSAYPFEQELLDYSLSEDNVLLFNGITIYSLNQ